MTPEKAIELIEKIEPYLALHTEAQLADFGETAAGGPYFKMRLPDPEELTVFRGKDRATKTKQGTRYIVMLIEIQDDETPVNQAQRERLEDVEGVKGGPLSQHAAMLCKDRQFWDYLGSIKQGGAWSELRAREYVLSVCGIQSRRELDHDERAARRYHSFIRAPFLEWLGYAA